MIARAGGVAAVGAREQAANPSGAVGRATQVASSGVCHRRCIDAVPLLNDKVPVVRCRRTSFVDPLCFCTYILYGCDGAFFRRR